ncbi:hypothetical protein [Dactylosporangium sp. CS-033363]|uniref:hypothetical protein n=1 Tax=Dactylosporangium sp. CS-033363 TaxID=3239935 RepID=UPI003D900B28
MMRDDSSINPIRSSTPPQAAPTTPAMPPAPTTGPPAQMPPPMPDQQAQQTQQAPQQPMQTQQPPAQQGTPTQQGTQTQQGTPTPTPQQAQQSAARKPSSGLWDQGKKEQFQQRWFNEVQTKFVEDPPGSVADAKQLIDQALHELSDNVHAQEERVAAGQANQSDRTEGLRDEVNQYHKLFDRVLNV